jgi:hypothetical protein
MQTFANVLASCQKLVSMNPPNKASHPARVGLGRSLRSQSWRIASFFAVSSWPKPPQRVFCTPAGLGFALPISFNTPYRPCRRRSVMRVRWPDGLLISSTAVVLDYSPILFSRMVNHLTAGLMMCPVLDESRMTVFPIPAGFHSP